MTLDAQACYRALAARDVRFDGVFYVGVKTTGVYCRPICPARVPGPTRCEFFARAAEAERAGFRACFRCRPELAPGHSSLDATARLSQLAVARIDAGYLNEHSIDELAASLGVTARHLRRAVQAELGASPVEFAQTRRLALAKQLLQDTQLPIADVAFAAGFASVRRFNALVQARFGRAPQAMRRRAHALGKSDKPSAREHEDFLTLRLDYRPPFEWPILLKFLGGRGIPGVEHADDTTYSRAVAFGEHAGFVRVSHDPKRPALRAQISLSLTPHLLPIVARLREMCDLDAQPEVIARALRQDPLLEPLVRAHPGLRVPGTFDGFETGIRTILGQQVSVRGATTLGGRIALRFGSPLTAALGPLTHSFPRPEVLANASLADVRAIGMPLTRAQTIVGFSQAVASGQLELTSRADPERTIEAMQALPGIGPWTAHYLAMRVLRWPNAFVAGDLVIRRALGVTTSKAAEARASSWQPWRAYAVLQLWNGWSGMQQGG